MVGLLDVHQLVQDDVVAHGSRHLHQPPVEGDGAARRATAPPRSLIANRHAADDETVLKRQITASRRQLDGGDGTHPSLERLAHWLVFRWPQDRFQRHLLATKPDTAALGPCAVSRDTASLFARDPCTLSLCERQPSGD